MLVVLAQMLSDVVVVDVLQGDLWQHLWSRLEFGWMVVTLCLGVYNTSRSAITFGAQHVQESTYTTLQ